MGKILLSCPKCGGTDLHRNGRNESNKQDSVRSQSYSIWMQYPQPPPASCTGNKFIVEFCNRLG